jgi:hypothetical protein
MNGEELVAIGGLDSSRLMSEPPQEELGASLTRLVAALEQVDLDALRPGDREVVKRALTTARTALERASSHDEPFPQED